jgi:hypothetical protein
VDTARRDVAQLASSGGGFDIMRISAPLALAARGHPACSWFSEAGRFAWAPGRLQSPLTGSLRRSLWRLSIAPGTAIRPAQLSATPSLPSRSSRQHSLASPRCSVHTPSPRRRLHPTPPYGTAFGSSSRALCSYVCA